MFHNIQLVVSREEAKQKLETRLLKGQNIKDLLIESSQDLKSAQHEFYKWNDFNVELLKQLFTTNELSEEYNSSIGIAFIGPTTFREDLRDFYDDVDYKIRRLESIIERIEIIPVYSLDSENKNIKAANFDVITKEKVFIVHGQDNATKFEVARFIEKIGFVPIILHEQVSGSKTIIEKIEIYSDVGFGIVLYTPCDVGARNADKINLKGRARQNVVFEHGFLIGKLGRSNVCSLVKGDVEIPNDISGIVYTSMDVGNWQIELAKELKSAGYPIDMNNVFGISTL